MGFSFFKKHDNQNEVRDHFKGFHDGFSENQKKAILLSLFLMANSDGEFHQKESEFFIQVSNLLNYKLTRNFMDDISTISRDQLFQFLNSLDESQKDWYIVTISGMLHVDGRAMEVEYQYMQAYFNKMGITAERYEAVIKKTNLLMNKFM
ncbi:MAG: TerB family tellurite resistance protein [Lentimicrobium sp.]